MVQIHKISYILTLFLFLSTNTSLAAKESGSSSGNFHHILECSILDQEKLIKKFGGKRCLFLPDGSVISGSHSNLYFFNPDMSVKWNKKMDTHHQLNLSLDNKNILVMGTSVHLVKNKKIRYDDLIIYDFNGKKIKSIDFYNIDKELIARSSPGRGHTTSIAKDMLKHVEENVAHELTHANSFYEIGLNQNSQKIAAFKPGNYIINIKNLAVIIIMDSSLKKILWSMPYSKFKKNLDDVHDVQVQNNGNILIYNNNSSPDKSAKFSAIEEIDPLTGEAKILFKDTPASKFNSPYCGGVQILSNGNFLISEIAPHGRAREVDSNGKVYWEINNPIIDATTKKPEIFQQIRRVDLSSFLQNNKDF